MCPPTKGPCDTSTQAQFTHGPLPGSANKRFEVSGGGPGRWHCFASTRPLRVNRNAKTEKKVNWWTECAWTQRQCTNWNMIVRMNEYYHRQLILWILGKKLTLYLTRIKYLDLEAIYRPLSTMANKWKNSLQRTPYWLTKTVYRLGWTRSMTLLKETKPKLNFRQKCGYLRKTLPLIYCEGLRIKLPLDWDL